MKNGNRLGKAVVIIGLILLGWSGIFAYGTVTVEKVAPFQDVDTQLLLFLGIIVVIVGLAAWLISRRRRT